MAHGWCRNAFVLLVVLQLVYLTLHTSLEIVVEYELGTWNAPLPPPPLQDTLIPPSQPPKVAIFYNLFVASPDEIERVSTLVKGQFEWLHATTRMKKTCMENYRDQNIASKIKYYPNKE